MDISALSLPERSDRPSSSPLFGMKPAFTSVNVSYETAQAHHDRHGSDPFDGSPVQTGADSADSHSVHSGDSSVSDAAFPTKSFPQKIPAKPSIYLHADDDTDADASNVSIDASSVESRQPFPPPRPSTTQTSPQQLAKGSTELSSSSTSLSASGRSPVSRRRARARSSISIASAECQNFIHSLKEPKYVKPLSADEIAWIFQDFYRKLRQDVLGSEDELLTPQELENRRDLESNIESILDRAERAVTCGDLHSKLFALSAQHDFSLQMKLDSIRNFPSLLGKLRTQLGLDEDYGESINMSEATAIFGRLSREASPKGKLAVITKTMQYIGDNLPAKLNSADSVLPFFIMCIVESSADDIWQNFTYIQRFRRSDALAGQSEYCLTTLEAAIHVIEEFTTTEIPEDVSDPNLFSKPLKNPRRVGGRNRSSSASSWRSSSTTSGFVPASLSQRLGETLNTYKTMLTTPSSSTPPPLAPRKPSATGNPIIDQRFVHADADSLTMAEVRALLREYKRLADYIETRRL